MQDKDIYILGFNGSHCAAAALLKNGEIVASASEERFTREKNVRGYPRHAIEYCLSYANIQSSELSGAYIGFKTPTLFIAAQEYQSTFFIKLLKKTILQIDTFLRKIVPSYTDFNHIYNQYRHLFSWVGFEKQQSTFLSRTLQLESEKVVSVDHHTAHAYAAYYSNPDLLKVVSQKSVVVTSDGEGDYASSKIFRVKDNKWHLLAVTPDKYSLGWLYANATIYLGMKVNEDEYKVMGLAPYARQSKTRELVDSLKKHWWVDGLIVKSDLNIMHYYTLLERTLKKIRFDVIAASVQKVTEDILIKQAENAVKKAQTDTVILGGGVFMNVKANMEIAALPKVKKIFVMPSASDESTAIGAAYFGYRKYCDQHNKPFLVEPISNIYLGPAFTEREVLKSLEKYIKRQPRFTISRLQGKQQRIAQLLAKGDVVARFSGRMEYGARALGNRSILANPSDAHVVQTINSQIKGRDFWMPFAPTILKERTGDYIVNPKRIDSPFMTLAFQTTVLAQKELIAAIHQSDHTCRPQILTREQNPPYYDLIKEFEKLTGIGAVLNTSFNLHGEPIVCTPDDALSTFVRSGLQYLAIGDYLVAKTI